jgi:two-component system, cell cycle sensor histidine kinase DivJ
VKWLAFLAGLRSAALRRSLRTEVGYRRLAETAADMITRHAAGGEVEYASPAAAELTGVSPDELLGRGLFERVHIADRPAYLGALSQAFNAAMPAAVEFRLLRRIGSDEPEVERHLWVEMHCRPLRDRGGSPEAVVAVTHDISARRAQEAELRIAREAAEHANLAKSRFLAHMSHELRTPLNAIIGFSEILEKQVIPNLDVARQREYANLIHASGQHLLDVVNGILDVSKIESGSFEILVETIDVAPLIRASCQMLQTQAAERGVSLRSGELSGLQEIAADRRAVKQMLLNLLSNAIKFTGRGGSVEVAVSARDGMMRIAVADTGIGISADDLPRLGTPFVQADQSYERRYEGTGLGLSMVKGLAALHGGSLTIESRLGVGTTATVMLPIRVVAPEAIERSPAGKEDLKRAG